MAEPRATLHSKEMEVSRKLSNAQGSFEPRQLVSARDNLHPPEHQRCLLPAMAMALDMAGGTAPAPCSSSRASISKSGRQKGHSECQAGVFRGLAQAEPGGYQLVGNAAVLFQTAELSDQRCRESWVPQAHPYPHQVRKKQSPTTCSDPSHSTTDGAGGRGKPAELWSYHRNIFSVKIN